ncbi:AzlC protein [compost metagenome]
MNLRYLFISLSFSRKLRSNCNGLQKGIIGFGLTEEVYAISTMSRKSIEQNKPLTISYMTGLELLPYTASLFSTWLGIVLAEYIPHDLLPALNTSLYSLLIVLIVPELLKSRQSLAVFAAASLTSWLLHPYLGTTAIIVAMVIGGWAGGVVPGNKEKVRSEVI